MSRSLSPLIRRAVSALLAVCVSVCCCHAHMVADELSGPADAGTSCGSGSCCSQAAPADAPDAPAPSKSCKTCCIKGTGQKDVTVVPSMVLIALPDVAGDPIHVAPPNVTRARRVDERSLHVEPATLVRLRCALII